MYLISIFQFENLNFSKLNLKKKNCFNLHIVTTFNNTIISVTDEIGNCKYIQSSGKLGFKKSKRATGYAAETVMLDVIKYINTAQIKQINVILNGISNNRKICIKLLKKSNIVVDYIEDKTAIAYNGCKEPSKRRI